MDDDVLHQIDRLCTVGQSLDIVTISLVRFCTLPDERVYGMANDIGDDVTSLIPVAKESMCEAALVAAPRLWKALYQPLCSSRGVWRVCLTFQFVEERRYCYHERSA